MKLVTSWFNALLLSIFIVYIQNYSFFYDSVLCLKKPINLLLWKS